MTAPFYRRLAFDKAAIAATGPFSLVATLAGITLGGWLVARIGVGRALLWTGWAQTVAMAMYVLLSCRAGQHRVLYAHRRDRGVRAGHGRRGVPHLPVGALLAGVHRDALRAAVVGAALTIHTIGGFSGVLAASLGWTRFYTVCMFAALPAMGLMVVLLRRQKGRSGGQV